MVPPASVLCRTPALADPCRPLRSATRGAWRRAAWALASRTALLAAACLSIAQPARAQPALAQPALAPAIPPSDGDRAWQVGQEAALRGMADSAMSAYEEALRLARQDRDAELASAARLGMAEVWDVWKRCRDSARAAYEDAVLLTSEGDYAAADAYALWLARQGDQAGARAVHARAYTPIENQVPRTVTRESVNFLVALAAIQIANSSRSGALSSLNSARSIAGRLTTGDEGTLPFSEVTPGNYWVLHDLAALLLDPASRGVSNVATGSAMRRQLDAATDISDTGLHPRFTVGRLADRIARIRRTCNTAACRLPPAPAVPRCR